VVVVQAVITVTQHTGNHVQDFAGQKTAEKIARVSLIVATASFQNVVQVIYRDAKWNIV
jgi:hypothetical protein